MGKKCTCRIVDKKWQYKIFFGPRHVLLCRKHVNGRTIIPSGATALVSAETHKPGLSTENTIRQRLLIRCIRPVTVSGSKLQRPRPDAALPTTRLWARRHTIIQGHSHRGQVSRKQTVDNRQDCTFVRIDRHVTPIQPLLGIMIGPITSWSPIEIALCLQYLVDKFH